MIDVIDLKKNFHDLEVLKGINFKVEKGDIVAVTWSFWFWKKYILTMPELYGRSNIRKDHF